MWDVAVIGAGLSGIICARGLASAGYSVCVLDKSRGLGGRMATRRVGETVRIDHGLRYWQAKSEGLRSLTKEMVAAGVLKPWQASEYVIQQAGELIKLARLEGDSDDGLDDKYVTESGMSEVAKYLLQQTRTDGLPAFERDRNVLTHRRAVKLRFHSGAWEITCESGEVVSAKRCAIAIPAEQAADLLRTCLAEDSTDPALESIQEAIQKRLNQLEAVNYFPCITVMAGYKPAHRADMGQDMGQLDPNGWMVTDCVGTSTDWVGLDSSKRERGKEGGPIVVIHSKPAFAQRYIDATDIQPAASVLLRANARKLGEWVAQPEWFQIHRWRYAQVETPYPKSTLTINDTLACGGDWCRASDAADDLSSIDYAYLSGLALAEQLRA